MKIIRHIEGDRYEVELKAEPYKGYSDSEFQLAHDYFAISGRSYLTKVDNSVSNFAVHHRLSISIRPFIKTVLPYLLNHEYCQLDHLKARVEKVDGQQKEYWPYAYTKQIVRYYDNVRKQNMVAIYLIGEAEPNCVTHKFFNDFIKPTLGQYDIKSN